MRDLLGNVGARDVPPHLNSFIQQPGGDPDPSDSDGDDHRGRDNREGRSNRGNRSDGTKGEDERKDEITSNSRYVFDQKLKHDTVPQWDGNTDSIIRWILKVNDLASYSPAVNQQLGSIVPRRLQGTAEVWYFSIPLAKRRKLEESWDHGILYESDMVGQNKEESAGYSLP
ncbi:hypothetical protein K435DRAFT_868588 [Dendrothele bispora CBS 962.96]|uniref:Uncharacterized protein n=1 Tax=Dendrothele bispora (strain CBS 962.96) TaxID=1314807 RepID=A0A4S8LBB2_DENBC|nr:hypothetical protein K435DRAFT_868588 [Dendrothele bispora CBS 962.96]